MKWYWRILPWLMFEHFKSESEKYVLQQKEIAQTILDEANKKLLEIKKGNALIKDGQETQFAFQSGGVDYYNFVNDYNIPIERAFGAMDVYAEYDERTEKVYHQSAYEAIKEAIKRVEIGDIFVICDNALERMTHITNIDLLYKLASVYYFDKNENPFRYDAAYAAQKIAKWKSDSDIESFFLKLPMRDLLPSLTGLEINIETYSQIQRKDTLKKLQFHLSKFSAEGKKSDLYIQAKLLEQTLHESMKLGR